MSTAWAAGAVGIVAILAGCSHPSDQELIDNFTRHRAELERLVLMFQVDRGLGRVGEDFTRPGDPSVVGVSLERIAEYRKLCTVVGARACIEGYDATFDRASGDSESHRPEKKDPIWIHVSAVGLSISGSSKGYYYSATPQYDVVPSLDHVSSPHSKTWLRHIDGRWFLYYDYED